jgi:formylglycine-generating enzyme required for sulfatase activity
MMDALTTPHKTLFLSYSRKQTEWCDALYMGIDTYTAFQRWRDNKIPESADWWHSICLNIEGCFAFVALLTPDYLASVYCMGELNYALALNKPIIPLMLEDVPYPEVLNDKRTQSTIVTGLELPSVMAKLANACTETTLRYTQGVYSLDITPRPANQRPAVPVPPKTAAQPLPEEDVTLSVQIEMISAHGQLSTYALLEQYRSVKIRDFMPARELAAQIDQRADKPTWFDLEEQLDDIRLAEHQHNEEIAKLQRLKRANDEYEALAKQVVIATRPTAIKMVRRFFTHYPEYTEGEELRLAYRPPSTDLMPAPFAWVPIAGGSGTMKTSDADIMLQIPTADYQMAKYPATNAQYAKFIEAGGYDHKAWWTAEGWEWRQKENWTEPRYWRDTKWNETEQPVVGVSWFEAVAFCVWLSDETGENILLPTEAQWQYAAQGEYGRAHPWGNGWDAARCNYKSDGKGIGKTTPVRQYEGKGDSPFGVVDMAGNVCEWCLTDSDKRTDDLHSSAMYRVQRGGSWDHNTADRFRCDLRTWGSPQSSSRYWGFRLARV